MAQLPRSSSLTNTWKAVAVYFPGSKSVQCLLFFVIFPIYFKVRSYALEDGYMQRISKKNVCLPSDLTPLVRGLLQLSLAFMGTSRTRLCSTSGHESLLALVRREKRHTSGFRLGVAGHLACVWKNWAVGGVLLLMGKIIAPFSMKNLHACSRFHFISTGAGFLPVTERSDIIEFNLTCTLAYYIGLFPCKSLGLHLCFGNLLAIASKYKGGDTLGSYNHI